MATADSLTGYRDYEQIMIELAKVRAWAFEFAGEAVPVPALFNHATYAPAILAVAGAELAARQISCDLAFELTGEPNSLFGAKVFFVGARNGVGAQIMRIGTTAMVLEALPRNAAGIIQLDQLQYALGEEFAHYADQKKDAE